MKREWRWRDKGVTREWRGSKEGVTWEWRGSEEGDKERVMREWRGSDEGVMMDWQGSQEGMKREWRGSDKAVKREWRGSYPRVKREWWGRKKKSSHPSPRLFNWGRTTPVWSRNFYWPVECRESNYYISGCTTMNCRAYIFEKPVLVWHIFSGTEDDQSKSAICSTRGLGQAIKTHNCISLTDQHLQHCLQIALTTYTRDFTALDN